jgi:hypothetical protein
MPRFNPRLGGFIGGVYSNYRSYFKPDCPNDYNENLGDKQPYNDEPYEYPNQNNGYNNVNYYPTYKPYTSNVYILLLKQKV